jgi:Dual-action HEIGH metallo-peptidase
MHRVTLLALALALCAKSAVAAIIVNPAQPITHRVTVQVIQTALDNGSSPAAVFGDPTREAAIKHAIDTVWAQAGIDINFLPNTIRYNNTFAYQGALPGGVRPITDLNLMMANAQLQGGILHPNPSVINMFFVNVVPGWSLNTANWVNGVGNIGANGIAIFVGSSASAEHAGHWIAHELGHNLGLAHTDPIENLMLSCCRRNSLLTTEQVAAVFQTQFPKPLATILGDYDRDGRVDTSDYAVWRKSLNSRTNLAADGNNNGIVDNDDYAVWRRNFGNDAAGAGLGSTLASPFFETGGIPEPASAALFLSGLAILLIRLRQRF